MIEICRDAQAPPEASDAGWATTGPDVAMSAAREELALIGAQLNDGHARLVGLMRRVLTEELWCGAGLRSPEQWLTAYAGLTWSSAHDIVRIAQRSTDLPTMTHLLDTGRLTLGQAAVIAKYTPTEYDTDVAEFASLTTVTQLRRALCRYPFQTQEPNPQEQPTPEATTHDAPSKDATTDEPDSVVLPDDAADDPQRVDTATDAAQERAPGEFDPATAPPHLDMRYTNGRFHLRYDAPADIGALVEQALLEAKDTLFHLNNPTDPSTGGHTNTGEHPDPAAHPGTRAGEHPDPAAHPGTAACGHNPADPAQWRKGASFGEAFGLMAQRSLDTGAPPGHSRASRYRIYLHLDTEGHTWLGKGCSLPPALRARVLCDGVIQPIWETEGTPVSVGRAQRIVPARTRRLLEDRDRGCRFPGCLVMHHLECHHLDHWIDGGSTDADRMIMLCPFHHDEHHRGTFVMVGDPTRPDGVTFTARDSTRIGPTFTRYDPPDHARPDSAGPNHPATTPDPRDPREPRGRLTPYTGPVNETLHLSLVHFDRQPQPAD